jgi:hypothetical protein
LHPSSMAECTLRRQSPEVRATCGKPARVDLCGGRHCCPLQVILHGAAGNAEDHRNLSAAGSNSGEPEHLS